MRARSAIRSGVDAALGVVGLQRTSTRAFTDYKDYIPFRQTISGAAAAGLSVGDYIDAHYGQPGQTQATIDKMRDHGVFENRVERICEIGPGSGRYLEKVLKITQAPYCEIYETAMEWEQWLVEKYKVAAKPTDGSTLSSTESGSIDLVQAHKVLPGQPSVVICRYYEEMARILRAGGLAVFDIVTEDCMDDMTLAKWIETDAAYQHYPCVMPKQFTIDFFARRGFSFLGSFQVPMKPGKTECMMFVKR